jgi:nitroreductase
VLRDVLEVARWCGSGKNRQAWHFVVVRDRATLAALSRLGPYTEHVADAAAAIAVVMEGVGQGYSFDAGRVSQNIMLAAHAHGVASCNASIFSPENEQAALDLLGVPAGHSLRVVIALGYAAPGDTMDTPTGPPRRSALTMLGRKPLAEVAHYERFGRHDPTG